MKDLTLRLNEKFDEIESETGEDYSTIRGHILDSVLDWVESYPKETRAEKLAEQLRMEADEESQTFFDQVQAIEPERD